MTSIITLLTLDLWPTPKATIPKKQSLALLNSVYLFHCTKPLLLLLLFFYASTIKLKKPYIKSDYLPEKKKMRICFCSALSLSLFVADMRVILANDLMWNCILTKTKV